MRLEKLFALLVGLALLGLGACVSPSADGSGEASYSTGTHSAPIDGWIESN